MPDLVTRLARKWCRRCSMGPGVATRPSWCDCELIKAAIREALEEAERIVSKNRRHVELSPGVGEASQQYGLAVCDDIAAAIAALREAG